MRVARMPVVLTLDQVRSGGVAALPPAGVVHVCENPSVVEVTAARWSRTQSDGHRPDGPGRDDGAAPVLVCTGGQPSTAVVELVRNLSAAA